MAEVVIKCITGSTVALDILGALIPGAGKRDAINNLQRRCSAYIKQNGFKVNIVTDVMIAFDNIGKYAAMQCRIGTSFKISVVTNALIAHLHHPGRNSTKSVRVGSELLQALVWSSS